jgi:pimeloyl-ACP methyl ester carboxylesterase
LVHDIGGPVGFELAAALPERIASLTLLDTKVAVEGFKRPWMMEPFARRGFGQLWLASMSAPVFRRLMYQIGSRTARRLRLRSSTPT